MRDSLIIGKPYVKKENGKARLYSDIKLSGQLIDSFWYEVEERYIEYLCYERTDAFVVNLLLYAMEHDYDIVCEQVMSERLYYQMTEYLIPCIAQNISKYHHINIIAERTAEKLENAGAVGTALSGGVDSFYTILRHLEREDKNFNVTHLTFFNAGASGDYGGEKARNLYLARIKQVEIVAHILNKDLICVDSNINEFLHQKHYDTVTFRTLAMPLALQKLFSKYYFASGFTVKEFDISGKLSTEPYDLLNVHCLETEQLTFYTSGIESSRIQKLEYITDFEITYSFLNVCVAGEKNCGRCEKCQRTILALWSINKLDKYNKVFDIDYFNSHKRKYISNAVAKRNICLWNGIYKLLIKQKRIDLFSFVLGYLKQIYRKIKSYF